MAARALLKNTVSIEEWMATTKETKKHCTLKKATINHSNLQGKYVFMNNYFESHFFLYFTMIFVHLPVIVAACSFSVYKLIE